MQTFLSIFIVVTMLTQMMLVTLPPGNKQVPPAQQTTTQPAIPQNQTDDPCLVVAYATYLPLILNSSRGSPLSNSGSSPSSGNFVSIADNSMLQGRVLDANDAAQGIETPLAGVTVCHLESGKSTRTDINGNFVLTELPATESHIEYIGSTAIPLNSYASYRAKVVLTANNATTIERPIYLMKIDSNGQKQIDPTKTTTLTNENLGMELTIPPRTVKDDRGNNFAGEMSISEVPAGFTRGSLPIRWSQVL